MKGVTAWLVGAVLALIPLLAGGTITPAQQNPVAPTVQRIEVLRPGIYEIEVNNPIEDKSISTGNRFMARAYKSVEVTTVIHAKVGTTIGAELTLIGAPRRAKVPLRVVWRYPAPGLINPETKEAKMLDEYSDTQEVGVTFPVFWGLAQDWHLVSGTWTLEVWQGERQLLLQPFQVIVPTSPATSP